MARRTGDDQQLRLLLGSAAERHLWLGDYQAAEDAYGDALALASAIGDLSARPLLLAELGWVGLLRGALVTAEHLSIEAAELAEDLGNRRVWAHALRLKGEALLRRGDPDAATVALDRALVVAEELGAPAEVAGVRCSQACLALEEERIVEARRLVGEATALSALPHPMRRVSLRWVLGTAALMEGDLGVAEREFSNDLALAEEGQIVRHQANSLWGIARVRAAAGAVSQAAELHQRALALRHRIGDRLRRRRFARRVGDGGSTGRARGSGAARRRSHRAPGAGRCDADAARGGRGRRRSRGDRRRRRSQVAGDGARAPALDVDEDAAVAMAAGLAVAHDGMSD